MSDQAAGPDWWQASDGKWYPPAQAAAPAGPVRTSPNFNPLAIVSMVLAVSLCGIGAIPAIICGVIAKRQIRESGGAQTGEVFATVGIVFGALGLVGGTLYFLVQFAVYAS